jgi:hypothetical protein
MFEPTDNIIQDYIRDQVMAQLCLPGKKFRLRSSKKDIENHDLLYKWYRCGVRIRIFGDHTILDIKDQRSFGFMRKGFGDISDPKFDPDEIVELIVGCVKRTIQ